MSKATGEVRIDNTTYTITFSLDEDGELRGWEVSPVPWGRHLYNPIQGYCKGWMDALRYVADRVRTQEP